MSQQATTVFPRVTKGCHPATTVLFNMLDGASHKDLQLFSSCFDLRVPLFANLAGGLQVHSAAELIDRHRVFYASPEFHYAYEAPTDGLGSEHFFACSTLIRVVFPGGAHTEAYVDTLLLNHGGRWIPVRLINTVKELSQQRPTLAS